MMSQRWSATRRLHSARERPGGQHIRSHASSTSACAATRLHTAPFQSWRRAGSGSAIASRPSKQSWTERPYVSRSSAQTGEGFVTSQRKMRAA